MSRCARREVKGAPMTQHEQQPTQGTGSEPGISRRDVMKRGALVGGAMVWATPVVQTMARPAFAAEGTPVNMSWAAFTFLADDGKYYGFKVEVESCTLEEPGSTPCCQAPDHWDNVRDALEEFGAGNFNCAHDGNCLVVTLPGAAVSPGDNVNYAAMNAGGDDSSAYFEGDGGCGSSSSDDVMCAKGTLSVDHLRRVELCDDAG